jgi:hypothetical protein
MARIARALACVALLAPAGAPAGVVFRETEVAEPAGAGVATREVRKVSAQGGGCRIEQEASTDPLAPAGTWILVTPHDAFIVDPARSTIAPVAPTDLEPVSGATASGGPILQVTSVNVEKQKDEPGGAMLGLPTRHYVYRVQYREEHVAPDPLKGTIVSHDETYEFWATAWPGNGDDMATWRAWRVAEDAGASAGRRELRDAIDELYDKGFFLRQLIDRRVSANAPPAPDTSAAKLSREVTSLAMEAIPAAAFERPTGFTQSEYLAPPDDEPAAPPEDEEPGTGAPPPPGGAGG